MAGSVKSVSVVFQAFTDKFEKKVDKAGKKMGGFVKKAAGLAAGFVGARAAIRGLSNAMKDLDRIGKLSDSLAIDPTTLMGLDLAATQTGTSFEVMTKGIQRMVQTIGEARSGMSTGTLALKELGMGAKDFKGMNAEDAFMKMADGIAAIEDPAQKAAAANRLFGRSGKELLNILNQGSDGIRRYINEQKELSGPISIEDIRKIEEANDSMDKMRRAVDGIAQQVAIALAPSMTDILNLTKDLLKFSGKFKKVWSEIQDFMTTTVLVFTAELEKAAAIWENLFGDLSFEEMQKELDAIEKRLDGALKVILEDGSDGEGGGSELPVAIQPTRGFAESVSFQSSKAFDILNPAKPNSMAGKNAAANEKTAKATTQIVKILGEKTTVTVIPGG